MKSKNNDFLSNFSVKNKIIFLVLFVSLSVFISSSIVNSYQMYNTLIKEKEDATADITELAQNLLKEYVYRVELGELTKQDAMERAKKRISSLKFGDNYIWVNDYDNKFMVHPKLQGEDGGQLSDTKGFRIVVEGTKIARERGQGFMHYYWSKTSSGTENGVLKISHVRDFPEWNWVVGTGQFADEASATVKSTVITNFFITLVLMAGIIILVFFTIVKSIVTPIDKIKELLNDNAKQVANASNSLANSSQQLAEGSSEQASALEQTSATLQESASMVRQNTENTKQAAQLAKQAREYASRGNIEMKEMLASMEEIKKSSDQIAKIIKVIDDIAFQTNILALNAAVEAARAGEAGMGFAVVAEEVRNLAQRSAQAVKDTATIIESNIELSERGVDVSHKVNKSLEDINLEAQKVNELLDEIAAASQEQTQGIAQINKAITQMESVVQNNAEKAEDSASASEQLSAQAQNLKEIVNHLIVMVEGAHAGLEQVNYNALENNAPKYKHIGTEQRSSARVKSLNTRVKQSKNTKIVDPEDVIPLEDDSSDF